jgi:hypothetical protein
MTVVYDADGGTGGSCGDANYCPPGEVTGLTKVYYNTEVGPEPELGNYDPNITNIGEYVVRIGDSLQKAAIGWSGYAGDINDLRIYDRALTEAEVFYLNGIIIPTKVENTSPANIVVRVPDPATDPNYYPDNLDIVNLKDYSVLAAHWLEPAVFWP